MPRDHISDLELTSCKTPLGDGTDSGEEYSSLDINSASWLLWLPPTYVPVFPDRTGLFPIISREVPKSESIALGLDESLKVGVNAKWDTHISLPSSQVKSTFPGFRSKCSIERSCCRKWEWITKFLICYSQESKVLRLHHGTSSLLHPRSINGLPSGTVIFSLVSFHPRQGSRVAYALAPLE